jgi:hypothetical protein
VLSVFPKEAKRQKILPMFGKTIPGHRGRQAFLFDPRQLSCLWHKTSFSNLAHGTPSAYPLGMTVKEKILRTVDGLPDDTSIEEAMERLLFLGKIETGLRQADAGETVPHSAVRERMAKWLK